MRILKGSFLLGVFFLPLLSWGQASSSLMIPLNNQTIQSLGGLSAQIDLIREIKKLKPALANNIEIQMVRLEAKANVGGAQIYLKINNSPVDSALVDTNPDLFSSVDSRSFEKFELKNIDRALISSASLQLSNLSKLKIQNVEVVLGSVQEPVIFGKYANDQIAQVGGVVTDTRPSQQTSDTILANYFNFGDPAPVSSKATTTVPVVNAQVRPVPAAKPVIQPRPIVTAPHGCLRSSRGELFCVGDLVVNRYGYEQEIIAINKRNRSVLLRCEEIADEPYAQYVDRL